MSQIYIQKSDTMPSPSMILKIQKDDKEDNGGFDDSDDYEGGGHDDINAGADYGADDSGEDGGDSNDDGSFDPHLSL